MSAIFIHAAILNGCKQRILQYLDIIYNSKLIESVNYIFICFIGCDPIPLDENSILNYNSNKNIFLIKLTDNILEYELPTLNYMYNFVPILKP